MIKMDRFGLQVQRDEVIKSLAEEEEQEGGEE